MTAISLRAPLRDLGSGWQYTIKIFIIEHILTFISKVNLKIKLYKVVV
jgi:hypothetical protein